MLKLIHVKYRNSQEGFVDDITLDELIRSRKIMHFYRPSEGMWIDIELDPVRLQESQSGGFVRRVSDGEDKQDLFLQALQSLVDKKDAEQFHKEPRSLLSKLFKRNPEPIQPSQTMTAEEWFEKGLIALHTEDDEIGALRALAKSIHLDPTHQRAYLKRGITYEKIGNLHQAIDDYCKAIELDPENAKLYYLCGLARKRLGQYEEAKLDLDKAARLGHRQAIEYLKSKFNPV